MSERTRIAIKTPEAKRENSVSRTGKTDFSQSISSPINHILHLHRTIGNRAVQRLFSSGAIQAKLKIGQPNDIYEQEADRVAAQVMRIPEPAIQLTWASNSPSCREEESVQTKPLPIKITSQIQRQPEEEEEEIQTKLISPVRGKMGSALDMGH